MPGAGASSIKRSEHIFSEADQVRALMSAQGFQYVQVSTVAKQITFPSVLDYVRFQLVATPMAGLLRGRDPDERENTILSITADTQSFLDQKCFRNGRLLSPQESYVALAYRAP